MRTWRVERLIGRPLSTSAAATLWLGAGQLAHAQPEARMAPALVYDTARSVAVLFGGYVPSSQHYGDTWEYDRGRWCFRTQFPLGRAGPVNGAYDAGAGAVFVTIGGGETWAWDGTVWSHRASQNLYTAFGAAMVYDERRGVLVQHGGWPTFPNPTWSDTWEWNGQIWSRVSDQGPSNQWYTSMVYDSRRGVCVVFPEDGPSSSTWEWDGVQWRLVSLVGPPERKTTSLAYDSVRGVTVMFGGQKPGGPGTHILFGDTWEYDGTEWRERPVPGPSPRFGHGITFDSNRGVTVLFGGLTAKGVSNETWEWDGESWTLIDAICYPDCDTTTGPCVLDIFDFLCFGNRFAAGDPYACDCDLSTGAGVCDVFDFLCFGNAFSAGCL